MSNQSTPGKQTVELRQSRIRRDPPARVEKPAAPRNQLRWDPSERETWIVVIGIILFAAAIFAVTLGISDITSR